MQQKNNSKSPLRYGRKDLFYEFYNCELKLSKLSHFDEMKAVIFIIDLTSYHRTVIDPDTNKEINEMKLTLKHFQKICNIRHIIFCCLNFVVCVCVCVCVCLCVCVFVWVFF